MGSVSQRLHVGSSCFLSLATVNPNLITIRKPLLEIIVLTGMWSLLGLFIASPGRVELLRSYRLCVHRTAPSGVSAPLALLGFTASISFRICVQ